MVIAIIGILSSLIGSAVGSALSRAKKVRSASNLRQMALAVVAYSTDNRRLPGRVNRAISTPNFVSDNVRHRWFCTYMIDAGMLSDTNSLFAPTSDYGIGSTGHGYLLNNTIHSDPPNFYGRRSNDSSQISESISMTQLRSNLSAEEPEYEALNNIWMITNVDGENYGSAVTAGSSFAVSDDVRTPWGGKVLRLF